METTPALIHLSKEWLEAVIATYKQLKDCDKNIVIETIIEESGPNQLVFLSNLLPEFVFRDFLRFLPLEIVQKILQFLDGKQLLKCCQVSKVWNARINSLPNVWRFLAQHAGANMKTTNYYDGEAVATIQNDSLYFQSLFYKRLFMRVIKILDGLNKGCSIAVNENFIEKGSWHITSLAYQHGNLVTGCDDHTVQIWSVPDGHLVKSIATHSVSCITLTDTHLFTASFNANAECWDLATGFHCQSLCGHTSAVIAIDISLNKRLLLTGSVDKTAKLWRLDATTSELMRTLTAHSDWVFHVRFLPLVDENLQLLTCDSWQAVFWSLDLTGIVLVSCHVNSTEPSRFTSFYHFRQDPYMIFTCQWNEEKKTSDLAKYTIVTKETSISLCFQFRILQDAMKAFLLGAGEKFAVIMCSISRKDFHIIDIPRRCIVATIQTPDFCMLTRNGSTVTLCDTTWLDGFNFSQLKSKDPVFAACIGRNTVILGTWNV